MNGNKTYRYYLMAGFIIIFFGTTAGFWVELNNGGHEYSTGRMFGYILFLALTASVWSGTIFMLGIIYKEKKWYRLSYLRIFSTVFLANSSLCAAHAALAAIILKKISFFTYPAPTLQVVLVTFPLFVWVSLLATILGFLKEELEFNNTRFEELKFAKMQAEMDALKNQVDPHFIFNSLNALSYLIAESPRHAILYNDNLGKVYEYILSNRNNDLVRLTQEMEFMHNYFFLIKIRFADAVQLNIHILNMKARNCLIPPISLQILVENAIKHNQFNADHPLVINISANDSYVVVKNDVRIKEFEHGSPGTGLMNLNNRYQLITNKQITIEQDPRKFSVKLPLIYQ